MVSLEQIKNIKTDLLQWIQGSDRIEVKQILPPEACDSTSLVFVSDHQQLLTALARRPAVIIALSKLALPEKIDSQLGIFLTPQIKLTMSLIFPLFDQKAERFHQQHHIHPQSYVHPSAKIGLQTIIGPFAVIGANTVIGDHTVIGANTVIENNVFIGTNTTIHPGVFVGSKCRIGSFCEVHPNTTIGSDGFGYATDKNLKHHKIPQLGIVVIEDRVEIGANCAIDRAALTVTKIASGTKLDNLCHIAHNCEVGEDSLLAGGFFMAGSSKIGKHFMCGGTAVISDHVQITDGVILAGRSTVTNDILEPGQYGGYPLQPLKDSLKTLANFTQLTKMRKQLAKIAKHLNLKDEE